MDKTLYSERVAARIRERCADLDILQADIVRKTGAAKSTVNAWFSGGTAPRGANVGKLCRILRCSSDWLLEGIGNPAYSEETGVMASLQSTADVNNVKEIESPIVRVPALMVDTENVVNLDGDNEHIFPVTALNGSSKVNGSAWIEANSRTAAPVIMNGDALLVDTGVNNVSKSGGFYVISDRGVLNVFQVFVEINGDWSIVDGSRIGAKTVIQRDYRDAIVIVGRVLFRCGGIE
ncbi:helix-turn-helix domain-containing protein [Shewanella avicenniae]|uniref:Helix-turn-helix domain-containing protein n=1 Tax=Shewanella avicenniae TaxID=2814294 RepID=A0ABX7QNN0_9GAMM|nr:helix-turn-helix domain-containing protein [Shewanella avicenniae]QSX32488.1 helix-turn-helix domain-containing protein [Shewanella avicenniae]